MNKAVFFGVLAEISMKARILRERLKSSPESVDDILRQICRLEDELMGAIGRFYDSEHT